MKSNIKILLLLLLFLLTGCNNEKYIETDEYLGELHIFVSDTDENECDSWDTEAVIVTDEYQYHRFIGCDIEFVVKVDGEYVDVFEYIKENNIPEETIIATNLVYKYSISPLYEELGIDIDNLSLVEISVYTVDGEIKIDGLSSDWEMIPVDIEYSIIQQYVIQSLTQETGFEYAIKHSYMDIPYGPSPEIRIILTDGDITFRISLDQSKAMYIQQISSISNTEFFYVGLWSGWENEIVLMNDIITNAYNQQKSD